LLRRALEDNDRLRYEINIIQRLSNQRTHFDTEFDATVAALATATARVKELESRTSTLSTANARLKTTNVDLSEKAETRRATIFSLKTEVEDCHLAQVQQEQEVLQRDTLIRIQEAKLVAAAAATKKVAVELLRANEEKGRCGAGALVTFLV
jgi:hypothetical protein